MEITLLREVMSLLALLIVLTIGFGFLGLLALIWVCKETIKIMSNVAQIVEKLTATDEVVNQSALLIVGINKSVLAIADDIVALKQEIAGAANLDQISNLVDQIAAKNASALASLQSLGAKAAEVDESTPPVVEEPPVEEPPPA